jgi:hypothetical protein
MEPTTETPTDARLANDLPRADATRPLHRVLSEGCCVDETAVENLVEPTMHRRLRAARAGIGLGQLALGGALASRSLPGRIALWPVALVPTWYGISHLIAAIIGYRGCPELGGDSDRDARTAGWDGLRVLDPA